jgi:hypothetical protein
VRHFKVKPSVASISVKFTLEQLHAVNEMLRHTLLVRKEECPEIFRLWQQSKFKDGRRAIQRAIKAGGA